MGKTVLLTREKLIVSMVEVRKNIPLAYRLLYTTHIYLYFDLLMALPVF